MPKAYWIAFVTVTDPAAYVGYQQHAPVAFARFGAKFLVRGGAADTLEGDPWQRHVVISFDSKAKALECYNSSEYQAARKLRSGACEAQIVIVDGLPPNT